ncbi:MAG: HAD family phosphatase [Ruminococcaceae bacterium]|nr:HAD family phosphatase [Oscillospiraceae bacterium]
MFSVIFDMDGTLLDTQRICVPAWEYAGREQGISGIGDCIFEVCGMNETGWSSYLGRNFPELDLELFKKTMRTYIIENGKVVYKKGAEELISFLKEKGIKLALASGSSHASIDHHLNEVGAADVFDVIVGGKDVENGKPAPDIFLLAAEKLGADKEDCFVIEDSENGIRAGAEAGMKCIGIPDIVSFSDEVKALMTAQFSSLDEAIGLFEKML